MPVSVAQYEQVRAGVQKCRHSQYDYQRRDGQHPQRNLGQDAVRRAGIESWAPGPRELFVRIVPSRITGRRIGTA